MFSEVPPAVFALAAGIIFAIGAQFQNLGLARVSSRSGAAISIVSSAALYWLVSPWLLDGAHWSHPAVLIFAAIGLGAEKLCVPRKGPTPSKKVR